MPTLPTDSAARKAVPLCAGVLRYFPAALAGVARISKAGNERAARIQAALKGALTPGDIRAVFGRERNIPFGEILAELRAAREDVKAAMEKS